MELAGASFTPFFDESEAGPGAIVPLMASGDSADFIDEQLLMMANIRGNGTAMTAVCDTNTYLVALEAITGSPLSPARMATARVQCHGILLERSRMLPVARGLYDTSGLARAEPLLRSAVIFQGDAWEPLLIAAEGETSDDAAAATCARIGGTQGNALASGVASVLLAVLGIAAPDPIGNTSAIEMCERALSAEIRRHRTAGALTRVSACLHMGVFALVYLCAFRRPRPALPRFRSETYQKKLPPRMWPVSILLITGQRWTPWSATRSITARRRWRVSVDGAAAVHCTENLPLVC